jgi:hypothetical protein
LPRLIIGNLTKTFFFVIILIEIDFQFLFKNKAMQMNTAVKFLPIFSDEKKVEVSLENSQAIIKLSTWTEDLGWCGQKTMSLDAEMLDDLQRVISAARLKLHRQKLENQSENALLPAKVLQFPVCS